MRRGPGVRSPEADIRRLEKWGCALDQLKRRKAFAFRVPIQQFNELDRVGTPENLSQSLQRVSLAR